MRAVRFNPAPLAASTAAAVGTVSEGVIRAASRAASERTALRVIGGWYRNDLPDAAVWP